MHKLPVGIQNFKKIREENFLYIDKTADIFKLANSSSIYFLSRPRRFGKSLLISTLDYYFQGRKDLFTGLAIEKLEQDWTEYQVIHFDFNAEKYTEPNSLDDFIDEMLSRYEEEYNITEKGHSLSARFRKLLETIYVRTGHGAVVLVDEYDKPLLATMDNEALNQDYRCTYKAFFGVLKSCDEYLRFVLFTGVTKFTHVSIFSDLNQLRDISYDEKYSALCGITHNELISDFVSEIQEMADKQKISYEDCIGKLKEMYDGYHFNENSEDIYNPFSLLNALLDKKFNYYWFATGTPTFLIKKIELADWQIIDYSEGISAEPQMLNDYSINSNDPVPLLYQTGYLTIKDYDKDFNLYILMYPNNEVKEGFVKSLIPSYLKTNEAISALNVREFAKDLYTCNLESFFERLKAVYANLPYGNQPKFVERDFHNVIYLVFLLLGQAVQNEVHYAKGSADCVLQTKEYVYIFEFKMDKSAEEALQQIEAKNYAVPFVADRRKIVKIGVNFDSSERNITEWKIG